MKTNIPLVDKFLDKELNHCDKHDIYINFAPTNFLYIGDTLQAGWFDETSIHVAVGDRDLEDWLSTFVHETCHKDQFLENAPAWNTKIKGHDALDLLDQWLEGVCELNYYQMQLVIRKAQIVELDCEKRKVNKIINNNLPIDVPSYIKKANIYMYFYTALPYTRIWGMAPYDNEELLSIMPDYFLDDYSKLPKDFLTIMQEFNNEV